MAEEALALTRVIGVNVSAALAFQDPDTAVEILNALSEQPSVMAAHVYTLDGLSFARYHRDDLVPEQPDGRESVSYRLIDQDQLAYSASFISVMHQILVKERPLGYLYLRFDLTPLKTSIRWQLSIGLMVLLLAVLGDVSQVLEGTASAKGIGLHVTVTESVPRFLFGDVTRLRQILLNLAGNAVKFTEAGQVELRVDAGLTAEDGVSLGCSVRDTGIGIAQEALGQLKALDQPGKPSVMERVIRLYLESAPESFEKIQKAFTAEEAMHVRQLAHSLKSSSANLGAGKLAALCATLEKAGRDERLEAVGPLLDEMEQTLNPTLQALNEFI